MDHFTPADMAALLLDGAATILPWVGVAVAAALGLMFAFMGIRKGIQFFRDVAYETSGSYDADQAEFDAEFDWSTVDVPGGK